jgi:hypothetical protein
MGLAQRPIIQQKSAKPCHQRDGLHVGQCLKFKITENLRLPNGHFDFV